MFAAQIALAHDRDLPLVIHTREAWDDTFAILEAEGVPTRTMFHCFTGGPRRSRARPSTSARSCRSPASSRSQAPTTSATAAALCPLDRLLVETDAPYPRPGAAPGQARTVPVWYGIVGAAVAAAKGAVAGRNQCRDLGQRGKPCLGCSGWGTLRVTKFAFALRRP